MVYVVVRSYGNFFLKDIFGEKKSVFFFCDVIKDILVNLWNEGWFVVFFGIDVSYKCMC